MFGAVLLELPECLQVRKAEFRQELDATRGEDEFHKSLQILRSLEHVAFRKLACHFTVAPAHAAFLCGLFRRFPFFLYMSYKLFHRCIFNPLSCMSFRVLETLVTLLSRLSSLVLVSAVLFSIPIRRSSTRFPIRLSSTTPVIIE